MLKEMSAILLFLLVTMTNANALPKWSQEDHDDNDKFDEDEFFKKCQIEKDMFDKRTLVEEMNKCEKIPGKSVYFPLLQVTIVLGSAIILGLGLVAIFSCCKKWYGKGHKEKVNVQKAPEINNKNNFYIDVESN